MHAAKSDMRKVILLVHLRLFTKSLEVFWQKASTCRHTFTYERTASIICHYTYDSWDCLWQTSLESELKNNAINLQWKLLFLILILKELLSFYFGCEFSQWRKILLVLTGCDRHFVRSKNRNFYSYSKLFTLKFSKCVTLKRCAI